MTYYALYNGYGVNLSYDSIGWQLYDFNSKRARDTWVDACNLRTSKPEGVAEAITLKKLLHWFGKRRIEDMLEYTHAFTYDNLAYRLDSIA